MLLAWDGAEEMLRCWAPQHDKERRLERWEVVWRDGVFVGEGVSLTGEGALGNEGPGKEGTRRCALGRARVH